MTPGRLMLALGLLGVTVVAILGLSIWLESTNAARARAHCRTAHAAPVHTGHGHYLCVNADGRVVP